MKKIIKDYSKMDAKRVKLFNKTLFELVVELKKTGKNVSFVKIKNFEEVKDYKKSVMEHFEDFMSCKVSSLDNNPLLLKYNINLSSLSITDLPTLWKYFHNLYFISLSKEDNETQEEYTQRVNELIRTSERNVSKLNVSSDFNIFSILKNDTIKNLVEKTSKDIASQLEGKDLDSINPNDLITGLISSMSGSSSSSNNTGLDFSQIISKTKENLQKEIEGGNINLEEVLNKK